MNPTGHGVAVPCAQCGAALPVDLRSRRLRCGFCGRRRSLPGAQLAAVRAHLQRLGAIAKAVAAAASEADYQRRRRRRHLNAVLAALAPLLIGQWLIIGLGVGIGAMMLVFTAWPSLQDRKVIGGLVVAAGLLVWAGWVGALRLLLTRRRVVVPELPAIAIPARCGRCGASAPALIGVAIRCPFCVTDLLPDQTVRSQAEASAGAHLAALDEQVLAEVIATDESRAPNLENAISMMTALQVGVIGLAGVVVLIQIVAAMIGAM